MTLVSSGTLSIGGTATDRSINLELSLAQNANSNLGQTNFRSLAGVASGTISIQDFYGKSAGGGCTCNGQFWYFAENDEDACGGTRTREFLYHCNDFNCATSELFTDSSCEEAWEPVDGYWSNQTDVIYVENGAIDSCEECP
tara:strand:+ start:11 stop:436 length:426 start_codon:yes stop_codon:yes gene_type:complete